MRIGELSERTGASIRSIRYYEQQGLVAAGRTHSGQRSFDDAAVQRVELIKRLFQAGLNSRTMADLLPCITDASLRTPYLARRLNQERERVLLQIDELSLTVQSLDGVIGELAKSPEIGRQGMPSHRTDG